jgi:hypothetical protein
MCGVKGLSSNAQTCEPRRTIRRTFVEVNESTNHIRAACVPAIQSLRVSLKAALLTLAAQSDPASSEAARSCERAAGGNPPKQGEPVLAL